MFQMPLLWESDQNLKWLLDTKRRPPRVLSCPCHFFQYVIRKILLIL